MCITRPVINAIEIIIQNCFQVALKTLPSQSGSCIALVFLIKLIASRESKAASERITGAWYMMYAPAPKIAVSKTANNARTITTPIPSSKSISKELKNPLPDEDTGAAPDTGSP